MISNIDELLMGGNTSQQPESPEEKAEIEELEPEEVETEEPEPEPEPEAEPEREHKPELKKQEPEQDEYGNEKEPENEAIRERLARQARKHQAELDALRSQLAQQNAPQQVQQAAQDFEYNPEAAGDWQQQLASFVKQTVSSMNNEQAQRQQQEQERQVQYEFETKFRDGMGRFDDFTDVISGLGFEISNPMTLATRAMENPAAFLYAAAKRNPQELERISKLRDPYAQMTEIGKLEERMRKNKVTTKAPRPLGRTPEDATPFKAKEKERDMSGDDLLAKADAKRLNTVKVRLKGNR